MTDKWTPDQEKEFTQLYSKLEHQPHYDKKKAYKTLFESQLPFAEAKRRLEELIAGPGHKDLEAKVEKPVSGVHSMVEGVGNMFSGYRLAPVAAAAAIMLYLL